MVLLYPNGRPIERRPPTIPTIRRMIGHTISCIPNEVYPWDPVVVAAIRREFDPTFIPVFVKNIYRTSTGGEEVEYHHACAAATPLAERTQPVDAMTYRSLQPTSGLLRTLRPTRVHLHMYARDPKTKRHSKELVPFEWNVYWFLRTMRDEMTAEERQRFVNERDPSVESAKAVRAADEQAKDEERADAGWLDSQLQSFDVTDRKRIAARGVAYNPNPASRPSVYVRNPRTP